MKLLTGALRRVTTVLLVAGAATGTLVSCKGGSDSVAPRALDVASSGPVFTAGVGTASTLLGRATFIDPSDPVIKIKRITGDWHMELKAKPGLDIAIQTITFQPGGQSGWHSHPGPVFIQVLSGTMSFYESDDPSCTPVVRSAGQGLFLDTGDHAHIARNETGSVAQNLVTYFAPPGVPIRVDEPNPGNCSF